MLHMDKITKVKLIVGGAASLVLVVALGASAAIAASRSLSSNDVGNAVIVDAATELGVESDALASALKQAFKNRVEEALEAGRLTEEQARKLEERIDRGEPPLFGGLGRFGMGPRGGSGRVGHLGGIDAAVSYLGLTREGLGEQLRNGKTLAEIAGTRGKSVAGLVQALVDDASEKLNEAVSSGRLTREQADEIQEDLEERIADLVNGELRSRPFGHPGLERWPGLHPPRHAGPRA